MRKQGYRTSLIGKWHLGTGAKSVPRQQGYDYFFGFLGAGSDYFRIPGKESVGPGIRRGGPPNLGAGGGGEFPGGRGGAPGVREAAAQGARRAAREAASRARAGGAGRWHGRVDRNETPIQREGYLTDLLAEYAIRNAASAGAKAVFS
jgi:arylsulfatase A-like enzyme